MPAETNARTEDPRRSALSGHRRRDGAAGWRAGGEMNRGAPVAHPWLVRTNLVVFALFLGIVLLFGGASRADVLGQGVVRVAALVVIALCSFQIGREEWRSIRAPAAMLIALALVIAAQLIPVPPEVWRALPGRELYVQALDEAGIAGGWRPISLAPDLTLNSLLAVLPPLAAVLAMGVIGRAGYPLLVPVLLIAIALSALIGVLQVAAGSPYFYRVTNLGSAVGLFANRNHQALFLAMAFPLLAAWALLKRRSRTGDGSMRPWLALCFAAAVMPLLLVTGSRAGLLLGVVGAAAALAIALADTRLSPRRALPHVGRRMAIFAGIAFAAAVGMLAVFVFAGRDEAVRRLLEGGPSDARLEFFPIYLQMAGDFFPVGAGFGSFDPVFRAYEPYWALSTFYLNHAHNDPLQFAIEGGLPAIAVLAAFLVWAALRMIAFWKGNESGLTVLLGRSGSIMVGLALAASLVDYPLRTPIMAVVFAVAVCWMTDRPSPSQMPRAN